MNFSIFEEDLAYIENSLKAIQSTLHGTHVFITGANGFFGIWLIEGLLYLNVKKSANITIYALSRSKSSFYKKFPHLKTVEALQVVEGTVIDYEFDFPRLDYIFHLANLPFDNSENWATSHINFGIIGTQNIFETAKKYAVKSLLIASSGAVYRDFASPTNQAFSEEDLSIDCSYASVYSHTKRIVEQLAKDFSESSNIPCAVARCFAFAGAYLPLESFAFGEFIKNAILGQDIVIKSSGQATRSYLYAADLVVYLLTILLQNRAFNLYNVGSDKGVSLNDLAKKIGDKYNLQVEVLGKKDTGSAPQAYVPNMRKLQNDFSFNPPLDLNYCIEKMFDWNKNRVSKECQ